MIMMMRADDSYVSAKGCDQAEILECLAKSLAGEVDYDACKAACANEEEQEVLPGYATVSAKAAAAQTVALNAVDKKIGTITLKAGENDTTITAIEITKSGLGRAADIKNIQLMKNGEYVTNGGTLSKNVAKLRFRPNLVLKANSSETFDVVVSMAGAGAVPGGTHDFSVTAVTVSNGTFGGTPATLGSLTTTNYTIPTVDVDMLGATVNPGDENVTVATVTMTPAQDGKISGLTLTLQNSNESLYNLISNAKAYVENKEVGKVSINDETLVIDGLDTDVEKDDELEVVIKADVVYVGTDPSFDLVAEVNHVNAIENNNNERMPSDSIAPSVNTATVTFGASLGLTLKNRIKDTQTVVEGQKDVILLDTEISAATDVDVTSYYVDFGVATLTAADLDDMVLTVDGNETDVKFADLTVVGGKQRAVFNDRVSDVFTVAGNDKSRVTLKAKIVSATTNATYTPVFGIVTVKNLETNTSVTPVTPLTKAAHTTNINANGKINVTKATVTAGSTIKALEERDVLAFNVKAKNEEVSINSVAVTITPKVAADLNNLYDAIATVSLYKGDSKLASLEGDNPNVVKGGAAITATFGTLSQPIKADASETYTVKLELNKQSITTIGSKFNVKVAAGDIIAKGKTSKAPVVSTTAVQGTDYQIVTAKSTIDVAQDGEYVLLTVNNNSEYDMILNTFDVKVISKTNDAKDELLPAGRVTSLDVLSDNKDGDVINAATVITKSVNTLPGTLKVTWNSTFNPVITAGDSKTYVVRMNSNVEIAETDYTATAKEVTFYYFDGTTYVYNEGDAITAGTNATTLITETY